VLCVRKESSAGGDAVKDGQRAAASGQRTSNYFRYRLALGRWPLALSQIIAAITAI
jgi:hypothetical protein